MALHHHRQRVVAHCLIFGYSFPVWRSRTRRKKRKETRRRRRKRKEPKRRRRRRKEPKRRTKKTKRKINMTRRRRRKEPKRRTKKRKRKINMTRAPSEKAAVLPEPVLATGIAGDAAVANRAAAVVAADAGRPAAAAVAVAAAVGAAVAAAVAAVGDAAVVEAEADRDVEGVRPQVVPECVKRHERMKPLDAGCARKQTDVEGSNLEKKALLSAGATNRKGN